MTPALSDEALARLLAEDAPYGDLTTDQIGIGDHPAALTFSARTAMTVCGTEEAARMFELAGARVRIAAPSGTATDGLLLAAEGSAAALHRVWKTAQVLVELYSGIASGAAAIIGTLRAAGMTTPLACTRKHFPGTKAMAVKAVRCGGAGMHRLGLSETLLLFHEHRLFLDEAAAETVARLRSALPERQLVVEVSDAEEALVWAEAGVPVLQLERFTPDQVATLKADLAAHGLAPVLAIAGGVHVGNAVAYARAGAGLLVSSAPYYAQPRDVKVVFERAG
ncbi:MAG: ModD protein [Gallionellaceae bacterium]|nr:ModD protein [Gallionellaceae bacterium]